MNFNLFMLGFAVIVSGVSGRPIFPNFDSVCNPNPCENGGMCVEVGQSYRCDCLIGWTGKNCENEAAKRMNVPVFKEICSSSTCKNEGTCKEEDKSYKCNCAEGWKGENCEKQKNCPSDPCMNGGTCKENDDLYTCTCSNGYTGPNCENEPKKTCDNTPCQNGGTCVDVPATPENPNQLYICNCTEEWQGEDCERKHPCWPNPCFNNGICSVKPYTMGLLYQCECDPIYFTETNCMNKKPVCEDEPCASDMECRMNGYDYECYQTTEKMLQDEIDLPLS